MPLYPIEPVWFLCENLDYALRQCGTLVSRSFVAGKFMRGGGLFAIFENGHYAADQAYFYESKSKKSATF